MRDTPQTRYVLRIAPICKWNEHAMIELILLGDDCYCCLLSQYEALHTCYTESPAGSPNTNYSYSKNIIDADVV